MSDSCASAYWLSSDGDNDEPTPSEATTSPPHSRRSDHKNATNDDDPEHDTDSDKRLPPQCETSVNPAAANKNYKTSGKKRSHQDVELPYSANQKKKRRLNRSSSPPNASISPTQAPHNPSAPTPFDASMLQNIASILAARLTHSEQEHEHAMEHHQVTCHCCGGSSVLANVGDPKLTDYWYCDGCIVDNDNVLAVLTRMHASGADYASKWIVQISGSDEQWQSAKIVDMQLDSNSQSHNQNQNKMEVDEQPQQQQPSSTKCNTVLSVVYLKSGAEGVINVDDDGIVLRFMTCANSADRSTCHIFEQRSGNNAHGTEMDEKQNGSSSSSSLTEIRPLRYFSKNDEAKLQYLVKHKHKSYLHCRWLEHAQLVQRVDEYLEQRKQQKSTTEAVDDEDDDETVTDASDHETDQKNGNKNGVHKHSDDSDDETHESTSDEEEEEEEQDMEASNRKLMTDLSRVVNRWRKDGRPSQYYHDPSSSANLSMSALRNGSSSSCDDAYFDPSYIEIDRIIDHKLHKTKAKKKKSQQCENDAVDVDMDVSLRNAQLLHAHTQCLVKWRGLTYEHCSWESCHDLVQQAASTNFSQCIPRYDALLHRLQQTYQKSPSSSSCRSKAKNKRPKRPKVIDGHLSNLIPLNNGLSLKDYQKEGVDWICFNWHENRSVLLSDEMGLGKTCQTVAFLQYLHCVHEQHGPFLVIAPLSTLIHWKREVERFTSMYCIVYQGNKASRSMLEEHEFYYTPTDTAKSKKTRSKATRKKATPANMYKFNVLVTTYDVVMNERKLLSKIPFRVLVIDEAHRIKNRDSKLWNVLQSAYKTKSASLYKVLLTGTPIQNNVQEFWTLLHFIDPKAWNDLSSFESKYGSIHKMEQFNELRALLGSHVLRRLKCDVEKTLLPRTEMIIYVELTKCQKAFYRAVFEKNLDILYKKTKNLRSLRNIAMALRKVCLHPYLLHGAEEEELKRNGIALPPHLVDKKDDDDDDGDPKRMQYPHKNAVLQHLVAVSGKFVLLDKLLPKLREEGHKVLLYSQFTSLLDILEDYLLWRDYEFERIDGSTSLSNRQDAIDHFSQAENKECFLFLLSTKAGGVGINLVAADTVILFDSDWNPQNDIQAQSRCHRIGQDKKVSVYRLITRDSYEVYLFEKACKKLLLDDLVMAASTKDMTRTSPGGSKLGPKGSTDQTELEVLLKKSAATYCNPLYDAENEEKMQKFYKDDIDTILNENAVKIDNLEANESIFSSHSALSRAMFVPNKTRKRQRPTGGSKLEQVVDKVKGVSLKIGGEDEDATAANGHAHNGNGSTNGHHVIEVDDDDEESEEEIRMDDPDFWEKLGFGEQQSAPQKSGNAEFNSVTVNGGHSTQQSSRGSPSTSTTETTKRQRRRRNNKNTTRLNRELWEEFGSDFDDFTDSDEQRTDSPTKTAKTRTRARKNSDPDYNEMEDAHHDTTDEEEEEEDAVEQQALANIMATQSQMFSVSNAAVPPNPSYLGKTMNSSIASKPMEQQPDADADDDDDDDDVCVIDSMPSTHSNTATNTTTSTNSNNKAKKHRKTRRHKKKHATAISTSTSTTSTRASTTNASSIPESLVIDLNSDASATTTTTAATMTATCNPLSDRFSAVDYLRHRTPLYQVNTINIDNIHQRRGELSTATFVVGDWKFRVLVYPYGIDNPSYSVMNNHYMSVYLHYLGRADQRTVPSERLQTEFRCTIHSCLGSQHDIYQELSHKFCTATKKESLSGFNNFLPLSLLFRTPFYLFPDPKSVTAAKNGASSSSGKKQTEDEKKTDDGQKEKETTETETKNDDGGTQSQQQRNMAILKTELWIFPALTWKKSKPATEPIVIDLLDDSDEDVGKDQPQIFQMNATEVSMPLLEMDDRHEGEKPSDTEQVSKIGTIATKQDDSASTETAERGPPMIII